jgi:3',5'-cyclic AMP phosphodiesterase CpdA
MSVTRLLHLSDPHFGTVQPLVAEALARLAAALKPTVLVMSGDITQRAQADEFAQASAFCHRLNIAPQLVVPGNHDIPLFDLPTRLHNPYKHFMAHFGPDVEPTVQTPGCLVIGVNTTRWWRHKNGDVGQKQIDRVTAQLRQACEQTSDEAIRQLRVVVVHQPVHVMRAEDEHDRLNNWEPAVRAWSAAGADVVLGGHIHLPYVCELSGAMAPHAPLARKMWCVQAGTALSSRVRREAPNSVNLLVCDGNATPPLCQVERWDYVCATPGGAGEFERVHVTDLWLDQP